MRQVCDTRLALGLLLVFAAPAIAQNHYPVQGHPQGGDRRGTYYDALGRPGDRPIPLFKDPKIYLDNMTLLSHLGEEDAAGPQMMVIGDKRYLVGGRKITDVTDPKNPVVVNRNVPSGQVAYNQAMKRWIVMQPISATIPNQAYLTATTLPKPPPHPHLDKTRFYGVVFSDITDPAKPVEISRVNPGGARGCHSDGVYYDGGRYAYLSCAAEGTRSQSPFEVWSQILIILDVADMAHPKEAGRWWVPGQMLNEQAEYEKWPEARTKISNVWDKNDTSLRFHYAELHGPCFVPKRVEDGGDRAYCSWGQLGFILLDLTDISKPKQIGRLDMSPPFDSGATVHTAYPILSRKLVLLNNEPLYQDCGDGVVPPFVVDLRYEPNPLPIASVPIPRPPAEAPYTDFCFRGHRFGTHNANEFKAPGEMRIDLVGYTWFTGGFRMYDISNPFQPREIASLLPAQGENRGTETAFIEWDRKLIHVFCDTGHYILSSPVLGDPVLGPMKVKQWTAPGINVGAQ